MIWISLSLSTLLGVLLLGAPAGLKPEPVIWLWAACGFFLEWLAPKLPPFGFCATAAGLWLGLSACFPAMSWLALMLSSLALLLRISRTSQLGAAALLEALADLQPLALSLGIGRVYGMPVLSCLCWWLFYWLQPALLEAALADDIAKEWSKLRYHSIWISLATATLGVLASFLPPRQIISPILLTALLWMLAQTSLHIKLSITAQAHQIQDRQQQRGLQQRGASLDMREHSLNRESRRQAMTAAELEIRLQTYQLVEEMLQSIPRHLTLKSVCAKIVERLQQRFSLDNALLFYKQEELLVPVAWVTPYPERVSSSQLTRLYEPLVLEAIQQNSIKEEQGNRSVAQKLFPEDKWSLAIPLSEHGGLYLGHASPYQISQADMHFLTVLSPHLTMILDAAASYQTLQVSLEREARTAAKNEALVQKLALIIDGVTQLIRLGKASAMLQQAARILSPIIPHQTYLGYSGDLKIFQGENPHADLQALALKVTQQNLPLLFHNPHRLAVPLLSEQGAQGALVLERSDQPFDREDQNILAVLSYQLGSALVSARLYEELEKAHSALRDSQAQLIQSSKMAAIGQLAGGVAHELNTPLGAVALAVESTQMCLETRPDRAPQRLQRAAIAINQMKEIVSKLLFYARDARCGLRETNINQVITDTLQMVGHQLRLDNIQVERQATETPIIIANANELQQVLTNLILNARDAMMEAGAPGKHLYLATGSWEQGIWVTVRDQGIGMAATIIDKIFDPFFTTKDVGKGTGLGLSVTAQLVKQQGGSIQVRSQPGQGSEFAIRLPFKPPDTAT